MVIGAALCVMSASWVSAQSTDDDLARYEAMADTFLQAADFPNARMVIDRALALDPNHQPMQLRLARLLEWSGDPAAAYKIWKALAASGNAEARAAVARLAQSVGDAAAHLVLLQQALQAGGFQAADILALAQAYEYYGQVDEGISWLGKLYQATGNREALAMIAFLNEQRGDRVEAIRLHREHLDRFGFDLDRAVRIADLFFAQGRWRDSFAALQSIPRQDVPAEHRFWDLYASLAWELQQQDAAEHAYRMLLSRKAISIEAAERLGFLVFRKSPLDAAEILLSAYHAKKDIRLLTLGLQYLVTAKAFDRAQKELDQLPADIRTQYEKNNAFAMNAGLVAVSLKRYREALRLYRQVLQRSPEDAAVREAVLWVLIEQRNLKSLARALGAWQEELLAAKSHYLVLASAYSALNRYDEARRYYLLYIRSVPDDLMLRLTHAEMFDQLSRPDIQTRLKSDLFRTVMQKYQNGMLKPGTTDNDILLGQLSLAFMPNSRLAGYFEQVRKRNEAAARPDYALHELWLSWAINSGHDEAALRMMRKWERAVGRDANPLWGKLLIALKRKDIDAAGTMLDRDYRLLPRWDRIDAAREARQYHEAQDMAFETMSARNNDHDHEAHERFANLVTNHWNQLEVQSEYVQRDQLNSFEVRTSYLFRVLNDWWLQPWASTTRFMVQDAATYVPGHITDQRLGMHLLKRSPKLDIDLNVYLRDAWKSVIATEVSVTKRYNEAFSVALGAGRNAADDVSEPLMAAGVRDYARADLRYDFAFREFVTAAVTAERHLLQDRSALGSGMRYEVTFGHRIRLEYPDITVRIPLSLYSGNAKEGIPASVADLIPDSQDLAPDFFVPRSSWQAGIGIDYGHIARDAYSKAWRPFASADMTYNNVYGATWNFMAGIAGSVEGRDHLALSVARGFGKGYTSAPTTFFMHYIFYF